MISKNRVVGVMDLESPQLNYFTPEHVQVLSILAAVPGSVLWLPRPDALAVENLKREAERRGLAPERLIFAPHAPTFAQHLGRMALADLFLDAFPYGAHTVASRSRVAHPWNFKSGP